MNYVCSFILIVAIIFATIAPQHSLRLVSKITVCSTTATIGKQCRADCSRGINHTIGRRSFLHPLYVVEIKEFADDDFSEVEVEPVKTHGYEGDFKTGDVVRVKKSIRIWSVKPYTKTGFDALGFVGRVQSLALFGRKHKTLCSAITPIKVEFEPNAEGIPPKMFEKKWVAHFSSEELDLIQAASSPE